MEQRTNEWYLARKGKMTASEIYLLLNNRKEQMSEQELAEYKLANPKSRATTKDVPFNETTLKWLKSKVAERYMTDGNYLEFVDMHQIRSKAVEWGTDWEDEARKAYEVATGNKVDQVGFIDYSPVCGGSPDGIINGGIIEIKCPWTPEIHLDHLMLETADDLKEYNLQYYVQMQMNMLCADSKFGDFISYDPRLIGALQLKVLHIQRDEEICNMLIERIALAENEMITIIDKLTNKD